MSVGRSRESLRWRGRKIGRVKQWRGWTGRRGGRGIGNYGGRESNFVKGVGDWEDWNCDGVVRGGDGSGALEKREVGVASLADGREGHEVGMVEERMNSGRSRF